MQRRKRLGEMLIEEGLVTPEQVQQALATQKTNGLRLGRILREMGLVSELQVIEALSVQLRVPYLDLREYLIDPVLARLVPEHMSRKHTLIAINKVGNKLTVAFEDPLDIIAIDDVQLVTGLMVKPCLATASAIVEKIGEAYPQS